MKPPRPIKHSHRGHPSHEDYRNLVAASLKCPVEALEKLTKLESLPGVREKARRYHDDVYPLGKALREIFDEAVQAIEASSAGVRDTQLSRAAAFLKAWYPDRGTVAEAARLSVG